MSNRNIWDVLELHVTTDRKEIQKAYAKKTKSIHPEEHPEEFMELHEAYKAAIHFAKRQKSITIHRSPKKPVSIQKPEDEKKLDFSSVFEESTTQQTQEEKSNYDDPNVFEQQHTEPSKLKKEQQPTYDFSEAKKQASQEKQQTKHTQTDKQNYNYTTVFEQHTESSKPKKKQQPNPDFSEAKKQTPQENPQSTNPQEQTRQAQEAFAFGFLYQDAQRKYEEEKKRKRKDVLQQLAQLIRDPSLREKDWKQCIEDDEFQQIAEDPQFLKQLVELLKTYDSLPLYCFLTLSAYYQYVDGTPTIQKELNELLSLLDSQYPIYQEQKIQKQKKRCILLFIGAILLTIFVSAVARAISLAAMFMPVCIIIFTISYMQTSNAGKPLRKKQILILLLVILVSSLIPMVAYQATKHDPKEDVIRYLEETYSQDFSFVKKIKGSAIHDNALIYQFQDPDTQLIFEVKASQNKDGIMNIEDNYASSFITRMLAMEDVFFTHSESKTPLLDQHFVKNEAFDIKLQEYSNFSSIAHTLYTMAHQVMESEFYYQCVDYTFYVTPKKSSFTSLLPPIFTLNDLTSLSEEQITSMLKQAYVNYQLDYTLQKMDQEDPFVQHYFEQASGIDITVNKQNYHFDDVNVADGNITLGNFYRLAKHMDWNIDITGEDSFTWEYHGRVQVFGAGSIHPYIEQSTLETMIWGAEIFDK